MPQSDDARAEGLEAAYAALEKIHDEVPYTHRPLTLAQERALIAIVRRQPATCLQTTVRSLIERDYAQLSGRAHLRDGRMTVALKATRKGALWLKRHPEAVARYARDFGFEYDPPRSPEREG